MRLLATSFEQTRWSRAWQGCLFPAVTDSAQVARSSKPIARLARYSEMGFIIPAAILLGFFLGKLADYWLHTKWLFLVGLLFGAVVGFWQMIRMAVGAFKKDE